MTSEPRQLVNSSWGSFGCEAVPQEQGRGAALPEECLGKPDPAPGEEGSWAGAPGADIARLLWETIPCPARPYFPGKH